MYKTIKTVQERDFPLKTLDWRTYWVIAEPFDYSSHHGNGKVIGVGIPAFICFGVHALSLEESPNIKARERGRESYLGVRLEEGCVITCCNASPRGEKKSRQQYTHRRPFATVLWWHNIFFFHQLENKLQLPMWLTLQTLPKLCHVFRAHKDVWSVITKHRSRSRGRCKSVEWGGDYLCLHESQCNRWFVSLATSQESCCIFQ